MTLNMQVKKDKQGNIKSRGIEWTDATWNPIGGCQHACEWTMPDGKRAECYAKTVADRMRSKTFYEDGFSAHYWKPQHLDSPKKVNTPLKIFVGSMADVFGHWVDDTQINAILDVARDCSQHHFQMLTKNPKRVKQFDLPTNVWIGASSPPDFMWNKPLNRKQQERMLHATYEALSDVSACVRFISFEPLSWDVTPIVKQYPDVLHWAIIGAASNGNKKYMPDADHFMRLRDELVWQDVAVFYKGNLQGLPIAKDNWSEAFPSLQFIECYQDELS